MKCVSRFACCLLAVALTGCARPQPTDDVALPLPTGVPSIELAGDDDHAVTTVQPLEPATTVADAFASAWASKTEPESWWHQVSQWCEPALAQSLLTADPANVPASRVTGRAIEVGGTADEGLRFAVATNAGTLFITLAAIDSRWRVSTVDFQRSTS